MHRAQVAELVDAPASGAGARKGVEVRVLSWAPSRTRLRAKRGRAHLTHLRIWKFRPPPGRERGFANAYDANGAWAELFSKAAGYRGTELLRPLKPGGWWM